MGIQILGADGATVAGVDVTHQAQRVSIRPDQVEASQSLATQTGSVTTLASGANLLSLRYKGTGVLLVRRIAVQWITTVAFTTPQRIELGVYVARNWTTSDAGGLPLSATSGKHRHSFTTVNLEARVALVSALTAGARTLDPHPIGVAAVWSGAAGATMLPTGLVTHDPGDYPLALGANEGVVIANMLLMGGGGVGIAYFNLEISEIAAY